MNEKVRRYLIIGIASLVIIGGVFWAGRATGRGAERNKQFNDLIGRVKNLTNDVESVIPILEGAALNIDTATGKLATVTESIEQFPGIVQNGINDLSDGLNTGIGKVAESIESNIADIGGNIERDKAAAGQAEELDRYLNGLINRVEANEKTVSGGFD